MRNLYHYRAIVTRVIDGDTIVVDVDFGMGVWKRDEHVRLAGINAPETRGESRYKGKQAREYLRSLLEGEAIELDTIKDRTGKYGRYLAVIWWTDIEDGNRIVNVNDLMLERGFAVPYGDK